MNRIQTLFDREIPVVAVSFGDEDSERLAREAATAGVDVAELRIDQYSRTDSDHVLAQIRQFRHLPVLATIRTRQEGGGWTGSEARRLALFRAITAEVDAVDIELSSSAIREDVVASAKQHDTVVVVSHHNFETTPSLGELEQIAADARDAGADYVKVSTMARSTRDLRVLASLTLKLADLGVIVIAMGAVGTVGRILFPALGSKLTYSFIGDHTAPGQLDFAETFQLMRKFYPEFNKQSAG